MELSSSGNLANQNGTTSKAQKRAFALLRGVEGCEENFQNFLDLKPQQSTDALVRSKKDLDDFLDSVNSTREEIGIVLEILKRKMAGGQKFALPSKRPSKSKETNKIVNNLYSSFVVIRIGIEDLLGTLQDNILRNLGSPKEFGGRLVGIKKLMLQTLKRVYEWAEMDDGLSGQVRNIIRNLEKEISEDIRPIKADVIVPPKATPKKSQGNAKPEKDKPKKEGGNAKSEKDKPKEEKRKPPKKRSTRVSKPKKPVQIQLKGKVVLSSIIYKIDPRFSGAEKLAGHKVRIIKPKTDSYPQLEKRLKPKEDEVIIAIERANGQIQIEKIKFRALSEIGKLGENDTKSFLPKEDQKTPVEEFAEMFDFSGLTPRRLDRKKKTPSNYAGLQGEELFIVDHAKYCHIKQYLSLCRFFRGNDENGQEGEDDGNGKTKVIVAIKRKDSSAQGKIKVCFALVDKRVLEKVKDRDE